jgi:hypothetical protein
METAETKVNITLWNRCKECCGDRSAAAGIKMRSAGGYFGRMRIKA